MRPAHIPANPARQHRQLSIYKCQLQDICMAILQQKRKPLDMQMRCKTVTFKNVAFVSSAIFCAAEMCSRVDPCCDAERPSVADWKAEVNRSSMAAMGSMATVGRMAAVERIAAMDRWRQWNEWQHGKNGSNGKSRAKGTMGNPRSLVVSSCM